MRRTVQRWGNSLAVRLPADVAEACDLAEGSELDVRHEGGVIVLLPEARKARKYTLRRLVARITTRNRPERVEFGRSTGREIW